MPSVQCEISKTPIRGDIAPRGDFANQLTASSRRLFDLILLWQQRASERSHLASLSEHHLKDLGISRADVESETAKPFWRS